MDEISAWNSFLQSGSVLDYLQYRAIQYARNGGEPPQEPEKDNKGHEVQDPGTDTQTAEYR